METLATLATRFALISLIAVGGATAVVPEIERLCVDQLHWMDSAEFARLFAVAQLAPGPNVLIFSLIGWHMAGLAGLLVATAAVIIPSSVLAWLVEGQLHRFATSCWVAALRDGLVPLALGLLMAAGVVMAQTADIGLLTTAITAGTALFVFLTNRNPLWALACGAIVSIIADRIG
jgi:chromate transporter